MSLGTVYLPCTDLAAESKNVAESFKIFFSELALKYSQMEPTSLAVT